MSMRGDDDDGRFGWLVDNSWITGLEWMSRPREAIEADRKKRNRGLRPGGRKQKRVEKIVQKLADNAEHHVKNGGDFSFMRDARKAVPKIDPDLLINRHTSNSTITRRLSAVRKELISRGHKL